MNNQNGLFAKSEQMNLIGLIGCGLAVIGMLLPVLSINVLITSVGIGHFTLSALVILPLLLIIGAAVLYVMKMDKLAMLAAAAALVAYLLIVFICKSGNTSISILGYEVTLDEILEEMGSGVNFGFGFYLSIIGYLVAIAGAFLKGKGIKIGGGEKAAANQGGYAPQGAPQNPYMNQPQANLNPYSKTAEQMSGQTAQYMNQMQNQAQNMAGQVQNQVPQGNPYLNPDIVQDLQELGQTTAQNTAQQTEEYLQGMQQNNPFPQQAPQMPEPPKQGFAQQMQQAGTP